VLRNFLRGILYNLTGFKTPSSWLPHSKLYIKSENSNWVLDTIKEEKIVNTMANGIMQVFVDNPWFMDYIKEQIDKEYGKSSSKTE